MTERCVAKERGLSPLAAKMVFLSATSTLTRYGFSADEVDRYSAALARGELPAGFESIEELDKYILEGIRDGRASKARKKGP